MKRLFCLLLMICLALPFVGCGWPHPPEQHYTEVQSFSYKNDYALYLDKYSKDSQYIQLDGFFNTTELEKPLAFDWDAVEHAANECPYDYCQNYMYYDFDLDMWKIQFADFKKDANGNYPMHIYLTVYMTNKGVTKLLVYGENN